jgi:hypothetical protein
MVPGSRVASLRLAARDHVFVFATRSTVNVGADSEADADVGLDVGGDIDSDTA